MALAQDIAHELFQSADCTHTTRQQEPKTESLQSLMTSTAAHGCVTV